MDISFRSTKLKKQLNESNQLVRIHGQRMAKLIKIRMSELRAASTLDDLRTGPGRFHELKGSLKWQISADLEHPYRLIFKPNHKTVPTKPDGGLDWKQVTAIEVIGIEDTHE